MLPIKDFKFLVDFNLADYGSEDLVSFDLLQRFEQTQEYRLLHVEPISWFPDGQVLEALTPACFVS